MEAEGFIPSRQRNDTKLSPGFGNAVGFTSEGYKAKERRAAGGIDSAHYSFQSSYF